jgi:hypothetical protein
MSNPLPTVQIEHRILLIRGHKVMLDEHLAELYGVKTKILNQAVKRNRKRFPGDFMFQLSFHEVRDLRSQFVTSNEGRGGRRHLPYAFTEQGVAMLSTVLNSEHAVQMNIEIMRAFVRLRQILSTNKALAEKFAELERRVESHDEHIRSLFEAIRQLMTPSEVPRPRIGFRRAELK